MAAARTELTNWLANVTVRKPERIGGLTLADATRADFSNDVTADDLRQLAARPRINTLQTSRPVSDSVWPLLNDAFFAARPDVALRVYGAPDYDLSFARRMSHVRRFSADCLRRVTNLEAIAEMAKLESLGLGVLELQTFSVLDRVPATLGTLFLGNTESKRPSLTHLGRLTELRTVYLEGQANAIEVLGDLHNLEDLTLRSITTPDLAYLSPLKRLWSLDIKLGGIRSFRGIEGKAIKYLELWQIRGLQNADIIAALPGLQNLMLQSLPHVHALPSLTRASGLRRIIFDNLKGLEDFSALRDAPALEQFRLIDGKRQQPEQLLPALTNPSVWGVSAGFGSARKNAEFARLRESHGKHDWTPTPFEYR